MKLKIGLVPTIKENYKNQFSYIVDVRWFKLLKKIYTKAKIIVITETKIQKLDLIIFTGGNTSTKFMKAKENYLREKIDKKIFRIIIKKNIPCLGVCWGAQSIAQIYKNKLSTTNKHVGKHKINITNKKFRKKFKDIYYVNSYHNQMIQQIEYPLEEIFKSKDGSIEMFKHEKKKIFGIMWHPERNKNISDLDKKIFSKLLCN